MNEFMKNFSLEGKIAFVTGASYGIGFAIANALSAAGATIVFNDINQDLVNKGLAAYEEKGIKAHGYVCDVTDEEAVQKTVAADSRGSRRDRHSGQQRRHHQAHPDARNERGRFPQGDRR